MKEEIYTVDMGGGKSSCVVLQDIAPTLTTTHYGEPAIIYETERNNKQSDYPKGES